MVLAHKEQINAIINSVKQLPVKCECFDDADTWVGIVLELEKIRKGEFTLPLEEDIKNPDDDMPPVPDPSEYIVKETNDG